MIGTCIYSCGPSDSKTDSGSTKKRIRVIFDTDANNELDDQHAMAYLFSNQDFFDISGITVNATYNGGSIQNHYKEAERIMTLFNVIQKIPLIKGANQSFLEIKDEVSGTSYDGSDAVKFIISEAKRDVDNKLVILAVGKLTNVALALLKDI